MKKHSEKHAKRTVRLAQNLRANLLRRKTQARQRQVGAISEPSAVTKEQVTKELSQDTSQGKLG